MNTTNQEQKKWYDSTGLLIVLFFILPPLGIYGMIKRKATSTKKALYIIPASLLILFTLIGVIGAIFIDNYKMGVDNYNKKDYISAYENFRMVKPTDPNYNDAINKIAELKPIVDSLELVKKEEKENARLKQELKKNAKQEEQEKGAKQLVKEDKKTKPEIELPQMQQDFIKVIEDSKKEYKSAPNELKKSAVRTKRGNSIQLVLGDKKEFNDWVGKVVMMETTSKGNAYFGIKIEGTDITIMTTNNEFSNLFENSLITQSNPLYNVIAELKKGDKVKVSGEFLDSTKADFISEASLTENGSMTKPNFIVKFQKIEKY